VSRLTLCARASNNGREWTFGNDPERWTEPGSQAIARETHPLRCDPSITRDHPEPFDTVLSLELPSSVEPGKYMLTWFLDATFDAQAGAEAEVEILASGSERGLEISGRSRRSTG